MALFSKDTVGPLQDDFNSDLYSDMNSSYSSNDAGLLVGVWVRGEEIKRREANIHFYPSLAHLLIVAYFPSNSLLRPSIPISLIGQGIFLNKGKHLRGIENYRHLHKEMFSQKDTRFCLGHGFLQLCCGNMLKALSPLTWDFALCSNTLLP